MKSPKEIYNTVTLQFRQIGNWISHPDTNILRLGRNAADNILEKPLDIPFNKKSNQQQPEPTKQGKTLFYSTPRTWGNNNGKATTISIPQEDIRGRRSRYKFNNLITDNEQTKLYQGTNINTGQPVWIKELLADSNLNDSERKELKQEFTDKSYVNLNNGTGEGYRLITPWDTSENDKDHKFYLITLIPHQIQQRITLREYLREYLATQDHLFHPKEVRQVLRQVLQSLWFLHSQRIRFPNGEVRSSLAHGNISLDSLLVAENQKRVLNDDTPFYIYLADLSLWEEPFKSNKLNSNNSQQIDLQQLGEVCFYLACGENADLDNHQDWFPLKADKHLKAFINRLLDRGEGDAKSFSSAKNALTELMTLDTTLEIELDEPATEDEKESEEKPSYESNNSTISPLLLLFIFVALFAGLGTILTSWLFKSIPKIASNPGSENNGQKANCCMDNIARTLPQSTINYTSVKPEGTWEYLLNNQSIVAKGDLFSNNLKLADAQDNKSNKLQFNYQSSPSIDTAISKVIKTRQADFLITNLEGKFQELLKDKNLHSKIIGYEGIVVFVPFSDSQREGSLPEALNGKLSFEQLRKLYSGNVKNWRELDSNFPNLPVKLYIPTDDELVRKFKQVVFEDYPEQEQQFDNLVADNIIQRQATKDTLPKIFADFEADGKEKVGGVAFGRLSEVYGQCTIYPLSVGEIGKETQTLVQKIDNQEINPSLDLCTDKGSYEHNVQAFTSGTYPFIYPIAVVYQQGNIKGDKFAQMMQTEEGQTILSKAGIVPIRELSE